MKKYLISLLILFPLFCCIAQKKNAILINNIIIENLMYYHYDYKNNATRELKITLNNSSDKTISRIGIKITIGLYKFRLENDDLVLVTLKKYYQRTHFFKPYLGPGEADSYNIKLNNVVEWPEEYTPWEEGDKFNPFVDILTEIVSAS